jgi:transposase
MPACSTRPALPASGRVDVTFAHGPRKDLTAVVAALTLPYSNGPMEGTNTKVKLLKRQTYGRAGLPLLQQRILLS